MQHTVLLPLNSNGWVDTGITLNSSAGVSFAASGVGGWRGGVLGEPNPSVRFYPVAYPEGTLARNRATGGVPSNESEAAALGWEKQPTLFRTDITAFRQTLESINSSGTFLSSNCAPMTLMGCTRPTGVTPSNVSDAFEIGRKRIFGAGEIASGKLWLGFNDTVGGAVDNYGIFTISVSTFANNGEHPVYNRFPSQIVPESNHSPRWMPNRATAPGADSRIVRQSRPLWFSDLSNCVCNEKIKDYLYAILWRNWGMTRPVLNYIPTFCEIGRIVDRDFDGSPIVEPQPIDVGNGQTRVVQLRKRLFIPGYEDELIFYDVTKPHIGYPPMEGLGRTTAGPVPYQPMADVVIYGNGTPLVANADYTLDRNTGLLTHSFNGLVSASGGFYILMLMPNEIPMAAVGNGVYKIAQGIRLEEPPGGR